MCFSYVFFLLPLYVNVEADSSVVVAAVLSLRRSLLHGLHRLPSLDGQEVRHHLHQRRPVRPFLLLPHRFFAADASLFFPLRLEFALIGPIWIFSTLSLVCLSALTIKTILSLRRAKKWQPEDSQVAYWKSPGSVSARHLQPNQQHLQQSTQVESWRSEGAVPSRTGTPLGMERR